MVFFCVLRRKIHFGFKVIDLDGNFIIVGNNHGKASSYFYRNNTKEKIQEEDMMTMINKLTKLGLMVYLGT